jgi:hypothetical protein
MIGLLCFVLAVQALPFKSELRLEAENAALRHQLIVLRRKLQGRVRLTNQDHWFFYPAVSLVSSRFEGSHNHAARDTRALAQGRLSLLLALEVAPSKASRETQKLAKDIMGQRMPADQRRLVLNCVEAFRGSFPHGQMIEHRVAAMRGVRVAHRRQLETYVSRRAVQTRGRRLRPPDRATHQISASLFNVARKLRLRFPTRVVPNTSARSSSKVPENPLVTSCPAKSGRTKRSAKDVC